MFDCARCKKKTESPDSIYTVKANVYFCNDCAPKWCEYFNQRLDESIKYFSNPKKCRHKTTYKVYEFKDSQLNSSDMKYSRLNDEQKENLQADNNGGTNPLLVQDCDENCNMINNQ
jgi:hypothetical protein